MNLSEVIDQYAVDRRAKGFGAGTRKNELYVLRHLLVSAGNINTRSLRPQHIDKFWADNPDWAPGTMNRVRNSLGTFFVWCQNRGHIARDVDLMAGHRKMKVAPRERVIIPQSEFSTFLGDIGDPRMRAACAVGLYAFTRISEISDLRWQNLNFDTDTAEVFRRKTSTMDVLPLCEELVEELNRWKFAYAAKVGSPVQPGWFLIPALTQVNGIGVKGKQGFQGNSTSRYRPTDRATLNHPIKQVLKDTGYYMPYEGGHTLRRSGATALYNQLSSVGHDRAIRICQAMLGHATITTTEIYLRLDLDRKVRNDLLAGKRMFPASGEAKVVSMGNLREVVDGQTNVGSVRL